MDSNKDIKPFDFDLPIHLILKNDEKIIKICKFIFQKKGKKNYFKI
jgi:hypothetical protein